MKNVFKNLIKRVFTYFPFENLICALSQGKSIQSLIGKIVPEFYFYPKHTMRVVKRNEIYYQLDISDYQNWLIYFGLTNDQPIGLFELIEPNQTILDIGANIGQTCLEMAKYAGMNSQIIGFEPHPINFFSLEKNVALNKFTNLQIYNLGLGSTKSQLWLTTGESNSGGNRVTDKEGASTVSVSIDTLDNVVISLNLNKVNLIKMDVEGFEMEILKGGEHTLSKFKPLLFIELDDNHLRQQNSSAKELVQFLSNLNYTIVHSESSEIITEKTDFSNCHYDIVCKAH